MSAQLRLQVRAELCRHRVTANRVVHYYNFASQVGRAKRELWGSDVNLAARTLVEENVRRGLERDVLETLLWRVFTVRPAAMAA